MDPAVRTRVRIRAGNRCEYCGLKQEREPFYRFHIEHIVARQHDGTDEFDNLALACYYCNGHKGTNLSGIDPTTRQIVPLFNPRTDRWDEHFAVRDAIVCGLSPIGRATIRLLKMNAPERLELRVERHS
jgi:5-methylcytosine-specific restriction endonuclease McrA